MPPESPFPHDWYPEGTRVEDRFDLSIQRTVELDFPIRCCTTCGLIENGFPAIRGFERCHISSRGVYPVFRARDTKVNGPSDAP